MIVTPNPLTGEVSAPPVQLLTYEELGEYLGLSTQTLRGRMSKGGDLPRAIRIGRFVRFRMDDVQEWLNSK